MINRSYARRVHEGEEGHATLLPGLLVSAAGMVALGIGAATDSDWLTIAGGIAGVASKREGPSIKSYRDRTKYQEWEFVFDASARTGPQAGAPGQNPAGQGQEKRWHALRLVHP